jgi:hypothetical protein
MNADEQVEFVELMIGIGEVYGREVSKQLADVYWTTLAKYDFSDVSRAFNQHLVNPDTGQFFPKPADIVKFIDGNSQSNALKAWSKVDKAIRYFGPYQTIVFDDALIHAVISDMGGWIKLCEVLDSELPFTRNEFEKRYKGLAINPPEKYLKKLVGLTEVDVNKINKSGDKQFEVPTPKVMGKTGLARLVYKGGDDKVSEMGVLNSDQLKIANNMVVSK